MEIKQGKISILINRESTTIEIIDDDASVTFAKITLTPEQLSSALSRMAHTRCNIEVNGLDKVGKTMINKKHEFDIHGIDIDYNKRSEILSEIIKETLPEGWVPDNYFGSQDTFFKKDGRDYARTTIRQWIDNPNV